MWRIATASDDEAIVSMCVALNAEDPGPAPVRPEQMRHTLVKLRQEPGRGRAVVCDVDGRAGQWRSCSVSRVRRLYRS